MPRISLAARITILSRDQMRRRGHDVQLSPEEEVAAEESFEVYLKPVDLYNIIMTRTTENPLFLQRCLHYKLQAKNKRRIHLSVSISGAIDDEMDSQSLFPFYVFLARPLSTENAEHSAVYRFNNACELTAFSGAEISSSARAKFVLPEISKLSEEVKSGSLVMLLVSCADTTNPLGTDPSGDHIFSDSSNIGGYCLMGKIPMDLFHVEKNDVVVAETTSTVDMCSCYMKLSCLDDEKHVSFKFPHNSEAVSILKQVPVFISAEELGAKDISAYDLYSYSDIPQDSLPQILRLRAGKVIFNFKYYNDTMQKTEVTENYTCAFCLMKCASFKDLKYHLTASHDLFRFEFLVNEDYQVVNVSVKINVEKYGFGGVSPTEEAFSFCHRPMRRRKPKCRTPNANHSHRPMRRRKPTWTQFGYSFGGVSLADKY
ncbi:polycomb group protein EMBRYONIC FLOWER 2-like [Rutidosis leptorrhynchoides]|uniref:polycomb group protein EMBRYONIC FLOWER 2-like n=1 Tax=Rutidosis leptorrhynchoides TaxID=125765 RepID=UPI003A99A2FB